MIKSYLVIMSKGNPIKVEANELDKIVSGMDKGKNIIVKQGIINPSFYVNIVLDAERIRGFREETQHDPEKRASGLEPLENIFEGTNTKIELALKQSEFKQLK